MDASVKQAAVLVSCALKTEHYTSLQAFIKCSDWKLCLFFSLLLTSLILPAIHSTGMCKLLSHLKLKGICSVPALRTTLLSWPRYFFVLLFLFQFLSYPWDFFLFSHHQWFHFFKKLLPSSTQCWLDYKEGSAFTVLDRVQWRAGANGTSSGELWSAFMGERRDLRCEGLPTSLLSQPFFCLTWGVSDPGLAWLQISGGQAGNSLMFLICWLWLRAISSLHWTLLCTLALRTINW